jgi:NitT/TauT family transport system substrate-binding protein
MARRALSRTKALQLIAACAAAAPLRAAAGNEATIRVGVESGAETFSEPLYGTEAGIFSRAGLDVQAGILPSAGAIAAAIAGGTLDAGSTDVIVLANAHNRGVPLVAIAASGLFRTKDPTSGLCVAASSPLGTAKSFEGETIAVGTLVSLTSISLRMWLVRGGANPDRVQFVEMRFAEMPAALQRGTVAGAYIPEPLLTLHAGELKLIAVPYGAIAETFPISVVVAGRAWLAQNAETARQFVAALYATARWSNANRDKTAVTLAKYTKLDLGVVRRMRRTQFATALEPAMIQPILDAAAAYKLIDRPTNAADLIVRETGVSSG